MQAISLMSLAAGQASPAPAQGGTQTATTVANAGLFQGMLLEALLGGAITPELAAQIQAAPQPGGAANGQVPARAPEGGVLLSGPATVGIAPAPAPVPEAETPIPNALVATSIGTAEAPPAGESAQVSEQQPAAPKSKAAPEPQQETATPDAVVAQILMQGQAVPQPAAVTQPQPAAPAPQTGAPAVAAAEQEAAADPQLEAFVQRAVKLAQGEKPNAPAAAEAKAPAGPTFQDLVKLVAQADQAGTQQNPEAKAQTPPQAQVMTQAQTQAQAQAQTQTQATTPAESQTRTEGQVAQIETQPLPKLQQPHPGAQAAPEPRDTAPAPVKAPKAAQSPEKPADVNLAQAPRPMAHEAATAAPDAPQAATRQPVDPEQVIRQVSRFVKVMVDSNQSEVRLQLHPENLGSVGVRLVLGDGALKANLVAQDAQVKAALEANLDQLKTRLTDQGFQVEQVHVTVGGGDGGSFSQPQHSRQGEQRQPQQPWRPQSWQNRQEEENSPRPYQQRTAPTWFPKGAGARINSLA